MNYSHEYLKKTTSISKKLITTFSLYVFTIASIFAQAPEKFNYQGVARDNSGNVLPNQNIAIKLSIITGTPTGTVQYSERHVVTTNSFGLFSVKIGEPTSVITGSFAAITWASGDKYVKVELDPTGGSSYTDMGTSQLVSVPYALNSGDNKWTATGNDISNNNSGNVGIGTTAPATKLEIKQNSAIVEYPVRLSNDNGVAADLSGAGIEFGRGPAMWGQIAGQQETAGSFSNGKLIFNTRTSDGAGLETKMTILSDGNVGLGTSTPERKLHIQKNNGNLLRLENTSSSTTNVDLEFKRAGGNDWLIRGGAQSTGHFQIRKSDDEFATSNLLFSIVPNSGLVGIGSMTPTEKLHIGEGNVLIGNGNLLLNNGEVNRSSTGTANMVPIAYGTVALGGIVSTASSSNVSCAYVSGSNRHEITITGENFDLNNYSAVVTPIGSGTPVHASFNASGNKLLVYIHPGTSTTGSLGNFSFVVYKP